MNTRKLAEAVADPYKPGYDGDRLPTRTTPPERQALRLAKPDLVPRLHTAMLTLSVAERPPALGIVSGSPAYLQEFSDRVGEETPDAPRPKFRPNAAQVTDMDRSLALLEGLRPAFFKVVFLRALHDFDRENGGRGEWPWWRIGEYFGLSERWAEQAYDTAIVQAARRAGILPMTTSDYAVVVAAVWANHGWLTNLATAADARQAVANLRTKSPLRLEQAFAVWVSGAPVAKRIADLVKQERRGLVSHGSWYKLHPDSLAGDLADKARAINADWMLEEIATKGALEAA